MKNIIKQILLIDTSFFRLTLFNKDVHQLMLEEKDSLREIIQELLSGTCRGGGGGHFIA